MKQNACDRCEHNHPDDIFGALCYHARSEYHVQGVDKQQFHILTNMRKNACGDDATLRKAT